MLVWITECGGVERYARKLYDAGFGNEKWKKFLSKRTVLRCECESHENNQNWVGVFMICDKRHELSEERQGPKVCGNRFHDVAEICAEKAVA